MVFWQVGKRINQEILENERAEYGKNIVPTVSSQYPASTIEMLRYTDLPAYKVFFYLGSIYLKVHQSWFAGNPLEILYCALI